MTMKQIAERLAQEAFEAMAAKGLVNREVMTEALHRELLVMQESGLVQERVAEVTEALAAVPAFPDDNSDLGDLVRQVNAIAEERQWRPFVGLKDLADMITVMRETYDRCFAQTSAQTSWLRPGKWLRDKLNEGLGAGTLDIDAIVRFEIGEIVYRYIEARDGKATSVADIADCLKRDYYRRDWETVIRAGINKALEGVRPAAPQQPTVATTLEEMRAPFIAAMAAEMREAYGKSGIYGISRLNNLAWESAAEKVAEMASVYYKQNGSPSVFEIAKSARIAAFQHISAATPWDNLQSHTRNAWVKVVSAGMRKWLEFQPR